MSSKKPVLARLGSSPEEYSKLGISPDHIEVGSFIGLAAVTRGDILIEDAALPHLDSTLLAFERMGIHCEPRGNDLYVSADQERAIRMKEKGVFVVPQKGALRVALCSVAEKDIPRLCEALAR